MQSPVDTNVPHVLLQPIVDRGLDQVELCRGELRQLIEDTLKREVEVVHDAQVQQKTCQ